MTDHDENLATNTQTNADDENGGSGFGRYLIFGAVGAVVVILLPLIIGLLVILLNTNTTATAERFGMIRDVVIIILSMQAVLIIVSLAVLGLQIVRLVVLLQTEISPILDEAKKTAQTARGTAEFVGKNVTTPLIQTRSFAAGAWVFIREVGGIRKAIRKSPNGRNKVNNGK